MLLPLCTNVAARIVFVAFTIVGNAEPDAPASVTTSPFTMTLRPRPSSGNRAPVLTLTMLTVPWYSCVTCVRLVTTPSTVTVQYASMSTTCKNCRLLLPAVNAPV